MGRAGTAAAGAGGAGPASRFVGGGGGSPRTAATEGPGVGVKMAELLLGSSPTSKDIDRSMADLSLRVSHASLSVAACAKAQQLNPIAPVASLLRY